MDIASKIEAAYRARSEAVAEKHRSTRWISLYKDGTVARDVVDRANTDVLYNIPIDTFYLNQKSRLLFCYNDGHVNAMITKELFEKKLKEKGFKSRGFKRDTVRTLVRVIVCHEEDYLVICSKSGRYIKAIQVKNIRVHKTMDAGGIQCLTDEDPTRWLVAPRELNVTIKPILYKSPVPGKLTDKHRSLVDALLAQNELAMELSPRPVEQLEPRG